MMTLLTNYEHIPLLFIKLTVVAISDLININMVESSKRSADFEISDIIWSMVENVIKTDDELLANIPLQI